MFDYALLEDVFSGRVAFRQTKDECTPKIHPNLLLGRVFVDAVRDAKTFLQPEIIYSTVDEFAKSKTVNTKVWDSVTTFNVGDRVKYNDSVNEFVYYCTANNSNQIPSFDSDFWETDLSNYLRQTRKDSINEALASVVIENNTNKYLRSTIQFANYFEEIYNYTDFKSTEFKLSYIRLVMSSNRHLKMTINKIGIKVDTPQTLTFYLFHSSQPNAIRTFDIDLLSGFKWYEIEPLIELSYLSNNNAKGVFMLGFYDKDVLGNVQVTDAYRKPIGNGCNLFSAYFDKTDGANELDYTQTPDIVRDGSITIDNIAYFNFQYTIGLDYTYAVQQATSMFDKFIQYDTALRIILDSRNSGRLNPNKSDLKGRFNAILNDGFVEFGDYEKKSQLGLCSEVDKLRSQLKINMNYQGGEPFNVNFG